MVLNIHTTPLPLYRGAANDSWMILNNELGKIAEPFSSCEIEFIYNYEAA